MSDRTEWNLLARYLSDECSAEERIEVEERIAADPAKHRLLESLRTAWETSPRPETSDVDGLWSEVAAETGIAPGVPRKRRDRGTVVPLSGRLRPLLRYAAVAALLLIATFAYFQMRESGLLPGNGQTSEWAVLKVKNGARERLMLNDGTRVHLDAGSSLRYPERFAGDRRTLFLEGEAYFEVAHSADRPFVVRADRAVVEVLGTRFNVRAWQAEESVTVSVVEGRVALGAAEGEREVVEIAGGQISILPRIGPPTQPRADPTARHLGWMHREAFFDGIPLRAILHQLERWHDVEFTLEDDSIATERLTMHIQRQSLDDILELIATLTDLDYRRAGRSIHLKPRAR